MKAAWYEKQGPAGEVLRVGEMRDLHPAAGEFRIRVAASGISPGDIKKRQDAFGYGMPYPRIIPPGDGAGDCAGPPTSGTSGRAGADWGDPVSVRVFGGARADLHWR